MRWPRVLIGVALVSGCTTATPDAPPPARVETHAPAPLAAAAGSFALDAYMLRPAAANDLDTVVERLTRACMLRFGQQWSGGARNEFDLLRDRSNRFGLADEGLAGSLGYHWDVAATAPLSAQQRRHLDGSGDPVPGLPSGGCAGEADQALGWSSPEFAWLTALHNQAMTSAYADPRATAVTTRWSACMTKTGFPYATPRAAATDARWNRSPAPSAPDKSEKRTALADVRCKQQVGFTTVLADVLSAVQARIVHENKPRLDEFRRMAAAAVARADTIRGDRRTPSPGGPTPLPPGMWRTKHTSA